MKIHIFWSQGWDVAPPMALRNAEAWDAVGTVERWSMERVRREGIFEPTHPVLVREDLPYAMQQDATLIAAQRIMGGLAVGADMEPLRPDRIREHLIGLPDECGSVTLMRTGHPCNGFSYFPPYHPWTYKVERRHRTTISDFNGSTAVSVVTGPRLWLPMSKQYREMWRRLIFTLQAPTVFLFEPGHRNRRTPNAWVNPGCNGDWHGTKKGVWD